MATTTEKGNDRILHEIRGGWPRDVLTWVYAIPPLLYLGAVAAGFAGFTTFVIVLLVTSSSTTGWLIGMVAALLTWVWWAYEHFGVNRESVTFLADRIEAMLEVCDSASPKSARFVQHTIPYEQVGTIALLPRESTILIRFGLPCPGTRSALQVRPAKLSARDLFDEIQQWMDDATPDHLYCAVAENEEHYSREFTLADVCPVSENLQGTGKLELLGTNTTLSVGASRYFARFDGFSKMTIRRENEELPLLAALCDYTATAGPTVQILAAHGLRIAGYGFASNAQRTTIEFEWGETLSWSLADGVIERDGVAVGRMFGDGDGARLELREPVPEIAILALVSIPCYFPYVYSMWHGGRAKLPRSA